MIHRAQRGVMECEPLSGNARVSFFFTKWKLHIFNLQGFPYTHVKFSPRWFIFYLKAKVSTEEIAGVIRGKIVPDHYESEVTKDNAS